MTDAVLYRLRLRSRRAAERNPVTWPAFAYRSDHEPFSALIIDASPIGLYVRQLDRIELAPANNERVRIVIQPHPDFPDAQIAIWGYVRWRGARHGGMGFGVQLEQPCPALAQLLRTD